MAEELHEVVQDMNERIAKLEQQQLNRRNVDQDSREHREHSEMNERIAKLEQQQFNRRKADQEALAHRVHCDEGFKRLFQHYREVKSELQGLSEEVAKLNKYQQKAQLEESRYLDTAPSAKSWEAAKQASLLTRAKLNALGDERRAAALKKEEEEEADDDDELIGSSPPKRNDTSSQEPPFAAQTSSAQHPGSASPAEEDIDMEEGDGMIIPDSQQNAQRVEPAHSSFRVNNSFDTSEEDEAMQ